MKEGRPVYSSAVSMIAYSKILLRDLEIVLSFDS